MPTIEIDGVTCTFMVFLGWNWDRGLYEAIVETPDGSRRAWWHPAAVWHLEELDAEQAGGEL